jgi:hypothetical protein
MMVSDIPLPLDAMNLVAAVDAQAELKQLAAQLQTLKNRVAAASACNENDATR